MRLVRLCSASVLFVVVWAFRAPGVQATEVTIETVIEQLHQWRSQFGNLRLVSHHTSPEQLLKRFPNLPPEQLNGFYNRTEFIWTDYGPGRMDLSRHEHNVMVWRKSNFTNGKLVFGVEYGEGANQVGITTAAGINTPRFKPQATLFGVMPLTHVWYGSDQWLPELLLEYNAKVLREEFLDGAKCVVIEMHPPAFEKETMWLDVERNFLPRRLIATKKKHSPWTFEVHEFREARPGVWFPSRGRSQPPAEPTWTNWKVVELEINANLPASLFTLPPLSPGTRVTNVLENREYTVGRSIPATSATTENPAPPTQSANSVSATPESSRISTYFAIAALVMACLGVWLHFRQRK